MFTLSNRSLNHLIGVNKRLIEVPKLALKITTIDFGIPEYGGKRSVEEQRYLFNQGDSLADGIHDLSYHQSGNAFDFYALDPETWKASWEPELMAMVACAQLQAACRLGLKVEWGGLWKNFKDMPHIQLVR